MLMESKRFPQQPARTSPDDGIANFSTGDDAQSRSCSRFEDKIIDGHTTGIESFACDLDFGKITSLGDAVGTRQAQPGRRSH